MWRASGGDEFAIAIPNATTELLEKCYKNIQSKLKIHNQMDKEVQISVSTGYALGSTPEESPGQLFRQADYNMYREKLYRSKSARSAIVNTLMKALGERDFITGGHAERMQQLVLTLSKAAQLPDRSLPDLRLFAQFHDIGKVGVPDRILFKPGRLTAEEYDEVKRHSEIGHRIALCSPDLVPIADWVLKHHEWWDGNGYPVGLKGEEIPIECRILAIADAYDALTNDRPYRKRVSHEKALIEIKRYSGIQFDPAIVQKLGILDIRKLPKGEKGLLDYVD